MERNVPKQWFQRSSSQEDLIYIVKVCKVGVDFDNPVRLRQTDCDDVYARYSLREEGPILHPRDDIMKTPGDIQPNSADREVPAVDGFFGENPGAMGHSQEELQSDFLCQPTLNTRDLYEGYIPLRESTYGEECAFSYWRP
jgi:hypothetical protein